MVPKRVLGMVGIFLLACLALALIGTFRGVNASPGADIGSTAAAATGATMPSTPTPPASVQPQGEAMPSPASGLAPACLG